jgi:hypothetical protein
MSTRIRMGMRKTRMRMRMKRTPRVKEKTITTTTKSVITGGIIHALQLQIRIMMVLHIRNDLRSTLNTTIITTNNKHNNNINSRIRRDRIWIWTWRGNTNPIQIQTQIRICPKAKQLNRDPLRVISILVGPGEGGEIASPMEMGRIMEMVRVWDPDRKRGGNLLMLDPWAGTPS